MFNIRIVRDVRRRPPHSCFFLFNLLKSREEVLGQYIDPCSIIKPCRLDGVKKFECGGLLGSRQSFTLVEFMIVIAILAILSAIVIFVLNPARLFDNVKDTNRMTDIVTIHKALVFMETWNSTGLNYGDPTKVYISVPDPLGDSGCANVLGLPTLSAGYTYACKSDTDYRKTDGNGWIPVDFSVNANNKYFSSLPVDPDNTSQYFYAYFPGGSYVLMSMLKNNVPEDSLSERKVDNFFLIGSTNRNYNLPLVALRSGPEPLVHDGYTYTTMELPSGVV